jgi:DNA polymerase III epsilon subunit-like protein
MARTVVFFDIETTGLSRTDDRIVSIAAIDMQTKDEYYEEVNPLMKVGRGAAKVHGLTDEHLLGKPIWGVVGPRFWAWLLRHQEPGREMHLFAHNGKSFDVPVLANELARLPGLPRARVPMYIVDTLVLCRDIIPKSLLASKSQPNVYKHLFQEDAQGQHNALGDVQALARIVERLEPEINVKMQVQCSAANKAYKYALGSPEVYWPPNLVYSV